MNRDSNGSVLKSKSARSITSAQKRKDALRKAQGFALTYLPFLARANCLAIPAFPKINARFNGHALVLSRDLDLGFAVDLSPRGWVVPVARNVGELTLVGLAKAINRRIEKARSGKPTPDERAELAGKLAYSRLFQSTHKRDR